MTAIPLDLSEKTLERLEGHAKKLGLFPEELLRFLIGWALENAFFLPAPTVLRPVSGAFGVSPGASLSYAPFIPEAQGTDRLIKALLLMNVVKCPHCTSRLTIKEIDEGKCHKCDGLLGE